MGMGLVGTVVSLWRYPVKSMLGEALDVAQVTADGLLGDRAYGLVDQATGKVVSAKHPRRWASLFACRATLESTSATGVKVTLPDGQQVYGPSEDADAHLTALLQRSVQLTATPPATPRYEYHWPDLDQLPHRDQVTDLKMPAGRFFDAAPLHLLTTATLDHLRTLSPGADFASQRFRPNLLIRPATPAVGFAERDWTGHILTLGSAVKLRITEACPRCVMTTLAQESLPADLTILKTALQHNQGEVGVYAEVIQGGTLRSGDTVRIDA